jgi:hypothetical protein
MDAMHVRAIYDLCMGCGFEWVTEVGPYKGFATSALVQAQLDGVVKFIRCIDTTVRPELLKVLGRCDHYAVTNENSLDGLNLGAVPELVIVDGDHSLVHVQREYARILSRGFRTIVAHDVGQGSNEPGPQWMLHALEKHGGFKIVVDDKHRAGMRTDRGLMLATRETKVWEAAVPIWEALACR